MTASRLRVGFLRHNFLPPSETFIYSSIRALAAHADVRAFALRRLSREKFPMDDVTVLGDAPWGWLESPLYRATTWSPRLRAWAGTVDVVHAHLGYTGAHALWACRRAQRPLVISYYGQDVVLRQSRARWEPTFWPYLFLARRMFRRAARVLVLSAHMRERLVAQGCPADKVRIVRLGIDLARFEAERTVRAPGSPCTVLMVGREVDKKGFDDGLRACAAARAAGADVRVILLGTGGPHRAALMRLAAELTLPIEWPDASASVAAAMAAADVLLVPSRVASDGDEEGTPTVICEGGAAGLPVVATRHAGIPEQVADGATGLLAAERDVDGLAAHLVALAADPERRLALGLAGRAKMRAEYGLVAHGEALAAIYREALEAI